MLCRPEDTAAGGLNHSTLMIAGNMTLCQLNQSRHPVWLQGDMKVELTVETSQPKGSQRAISEGSPLPQQQSPLAVFDPAVRQGTQLSEEVMLLKDLPIDLCVLILVFQPGSISVLASGLSCLALPARRPICKLICSSGDATMTSCAVLCNSNCCILCVARHNPDRLQQSFGPSALFPFPSCKPPGRFCWTGALHFLPEALSAFGRSLICSYAHVLSAADPR